MSKIHKYPIKLALIMILSAGLNSCYYDYQDGNHKNRIEGHGPIVKRVVDLDNFRGIIIQNAADVILTQGNTQKVEIEGQENILENLNLEVSGDVWKIRNIRPVWRHHELIIRITLPRFNMIRLSGSGSINTDGGFENLNDVELRIGGSGDMDLQIIADKVDATISGSGSISLEGEAKRLDFRISGSGSIYAIDLKAEEAKARITGSGGMRVNVSDELDASIAGSGSIFYKGQPRVNKNISGSGSIQSR